MSRSITAAPVALAAICGVLCLSVLLLHARVTLGENVVEHLLTAENGTTTRLWSVFYTFGGVCLLGVVPVTLYARYGTVTPAITAGVLLAGYLYSADSQLVSLFLLWVPLLVSAVFAVGTVEYLLRSVFLGSVSLSGSLTTALLLGTPHAVVSAAAFGELSPIPLTLSISAVYVVAVPALLFLQFDAVGPVAGAVFGIVLVPVVHWEWLPGEYPFVAAQALVPIFVFGGVEYLLRSTSPIAG